MAGSHASTLHHPLTVSTLITTNLMLNSILVVVLSLAEGASAPPYGGVFQMFLWAPSLANVKLSSEWSEWLHSS